MSTILVVQPDGELHDRWTEALTRNGHDVLPVRGVTEGIARAREGGIDVVVLDAPAADARTLVGELERLPDAPPLILVSESPEAPELSAQVGAAAFLPKPCASEDLVEMVTRVAGATVRVLRFDDEQTAPRKQY